MADKQYLCIDLKSFFASVECVERGLDPMTVNLVVADPERTDKTICLAITPAMKKLGIKNRCRMFEIPDSVSYIVAPPRMRKYIEYAAEIYGIYLEYIAPEDIHVYSIDEAFIDVTSYLSLYHMTAREMAVMLMGEIFKRLGIRATCGIGTNLYLTKIALDITAKHAADFIGELDEASFRETMWDHEPLTDFWRIGQGTANRLASVGIRTMRDITLTHEDILYRMFGIDAELLIDHAWGREPTTIADIKAYRSRTNCLSSGQVLPRDYTREEARLIVKEMTDALSLRLVAHGQVTDSIALYIGYAGALREGGSKGSASVDVPTSSDKVLISAAVALYDRIVVPGHGIRRINLTFGRVIAECAEQLTLTEDPERAEKDKNLRRTVVALKEKYGKNAVFKGMDLESAATARQRNRQIGGHKSGE